MAHGFYSGKQMQSLPRRVPFTFDEQYASFERSLRGLLTDLLERERTKYMPPENVLGYVRGVRWLRSFSIDEREEAEFSAHEHEITLKFEDIVNHRCNKLSEKISHLAEAMHGSIMRALYLFLPFQNPIYLVLKPRPFCGECARKLINHL
jgi:hypothetical protein